MLGAIKLSRRMTQPCAVASAVVVNTAFGGAPYEATKRVRGVLKWVGRQPGDTATGAFGGAPVGPRSVCAVCRSVWGGRLWKPPRWPAGVG
eukprot:8611721-Pyramimonas_sp.AAC.1